VDLRGLAVAAKATWPAEDDAVLAFASACSPEVVLALLDVAEAADATHELKASTKGRWWRDDGMAGGAIADKRLRDALDRWRTVSGRGSR
jgi:hypothetical protein